MTRWGASLVLFHTDPALAARCVAALRAQDPPPERVHVVCNDDAAGAGAADLAGVTVEAHAANLGYAGGHNAALAALFAAGLDAVLVVNPDAVPAPDAVARLAAFTGDRAVLAGPLLELLRPDGTPEGLVDSAGIRWTASARHLDARQGSPLANAPVAPAEVAGISGACLWVTRAAYERVVAASGEFFDEEFVAYREDAELGFRARLLGVPSWLVPDARVGHGRALRGTTRAVAPHVNRLGVQNRFLIAFKYGRRRPGRLPAALARDAVVVAAVLLRERSSLPGLRRAWALRGTQRAKGRRVLAASAERAAAAPTLDA
ncbi:MAG TPA: glycosyltransferase [Mycobacteriales bacterium]|jgi:GT2 family glycosyltransferase|nr:glycosyltransferase [Mycobacteriales bacterium]